MVDLQQLALWLLCRYSLLRLLVIVGWLGSYFAATMRTICDSTLFTVILQRAPRVRFSVHLSTQYQIPQVLSNGTFCLSYEAMTARGFSRATLILSFCVPVVYWREAVTVTKNNIRRLNVMLSDYCLGSRMPHLKYKQVYTGPYVMSN